MKNPAKWLMLLKACICRVGGAALFRRPRQRLPAGCVALLGALLLASSLAQAATVEEDDILVIDYGAYPKAGPPGGDKLILVDGKTGVRWVLSDFLDESEGPGNCCLPSLSSVAVGRGQIFVTDATVGLFIVDPRTGHRRVMRFYEGTITGNLTFGAAVDAFGRVVANLDLYTGDSAVVRVNPFNGRRAIVTEIPSSSCCGITDLTVEQPTLKRPEGTILIAESIGIGGGIGLPRIVRVDPVTGERSLLSDFDMPEQGVVADLTCSVGLTVEHSGTILANAGGCHYERNLLVRIDPKSGDRTVVSDFDNPDRGPVGASLHGAGVQRAGDVIVGASDPTTGAFNLYRVNPQTGRRVLFSDSTNSRQGPKFHDIRYLAVVPHNAGFCAPPSGAYVSPFGPSQ